VTAVFRLCRGNSPCFDGESQGIPTMNFFFNNLDCNFVAYTSGEWCLIFQRVPVRTVSCATLCLLQAQKITLLVSGLVLFKDVISGNMRSEFSTAFAGCDAV